MSGARKKGMRKVMRCGEVGRRNAPALVSPLPTIPSYDVGQVTYNPAAWSYVIPLGIGRSWMWSAAIRSVHFVYSIGSGFYASRQYEI